MQFTRRACLNGKWILIIVLVVLFANLVQIPPALKNLGRKQILPFDSHLTQNMSTNVSISVSDFQNSVSLSKCFFPTTLPEAPFVYVVAGLPRTGNLNLIVCNYFCGRINYHLQYITTASEFKGSKYFGVLLR